MPCARSWPTLGTACTSAAASVASAARPSPAWAPSVSATGAVDTGFVPNPNGTVRALALSDDGSRLYAGGGFNAVGGAARPALPSCTPHSGAATSFAPTDGGVVIAMDVAPSGRLYFGTTSNRTWAYDPADGGTPEYRVRTGGDVQAILATDDEVYIGGHFDTIPEHKLNRLALASFLPATGTPTAWNPGANGAFGVWALALTSTPLSPGEPAALSVGRRLHQGGEPGSSRLHPVPVLTGAVSAVLHQFRGAYRGTSPDRDLRTRGSSWRSPALRGSRADAAAGWIGAIGVGLIGAAGTAQHEDAHQNGGEPEALQSQ